MHSRNGIVLWGTNSCQQLRSARTPLVGTWEGDLPICTVLIKNLILFNKGAFDHLRNKSRGKFLVWEIQNF